MLMPIYFAALQIHKSLETMFGHLGKYRLWEWSRALFLPVLRIRIWSVLWYPFFPQNFLAFIVQKGAILRHFPRFWCNFSFFFTCIHIFNFFPSGHPHSHSPPSPPYFLCKMYTSVIYIPLFLGCLYKFHDKPITYLYNTLFYYEKILRTRSSLRSDFI